MKSSHEQFRDYRVSFSIADGELLQKLAALPVDQRAAAIELLLEIQSRKQDEAARENFMAFVRRMWPAFIEGAHHKKMADAFERVARGELKRVIINMPPRHTKPLKDTENITMGDGRIKRLRRVAVGDMVLTHMGRARKVLSVHDQGELSTVDIRTLSGQIIGAAPSHPFLTARGWVNAGDLVPGDKLAVVPRTMKSGGDLNLAYLAGYLIGDGSIGWARNGKAQKASITVADDMELAHIVRICDELGIFISRGSSSYEWHLSGGYTRGRTGTYNTWVRTGDFSIREWLRDNDMVSSSAHKKVPDFILSGSRDEMVAFLGAYFSCDGTVANRSGRYRGCAIAMTTISEGLAKDIHALLWRLGLKFRLRKEKSQIVYKGERKISDCWTLRCTDRSVAAAFLETVGDHIFHEKKTRLINEIGGTAPVYHGFDEVADVVPSGSHRCICLEVEEDHTFVASNVIVHNSEFASFLFPAWFLGKFPDKKVIQASHTAELAKDFGRNVRNLIGSEDYQRIFPGVELAPDNKAAGRWNTNRRGTYFAVGVDGAVAGKGADILVIDDPHNEQEATLGEWNPAVYDKVYKWYTSGPRQRLQPNGAIIVVMTRWSLRDLTGQIIDHAAENDALDEWEVIELPAILPSGNALWPEFWSLAALNDIKRDIPISKWNAQYQQHPTSEEGALIKREWWRVWDRQMPECVAILQSWDTAIEQTERANYSACTTWGIFEHPDTTGRMQHNLILLDAERGKWEFPELKAKAKQLYQKYTPDQVIIERRASGAPLLFELRSMGIPVSAFMPTRGNDKIVRVNAVTDIFASGFVWAPPTAWAREVMEECAAFPAGKDDDFVDSTTQALLRFRQGGYIGTSGDDYDDEPEYRPVKKYY